MELDKEIRGALARAYTYNINGNKVLDSDLLEAALEELRPLFLDQKREILERIGMLRQWLNEDRITQPDRMVSNDQIARWLKLDEPPIEGKDEDPPEDD